MIFSTKFFVAAGILGIALAGISIDPALLNLVSQLHYARLLDPHYRTVSASLAVVVGLIGLRRYSKARSRKRNQQSALDTDPYRGSHPFNK
ncbi:MAG TPA: hypothetical protein VFZ27_09930 [Terriglobia bacterium]|nr:hypothetical protein [Terriglobia bacterium]